MKPSDVEPVSSQQFFLDLFFLRSHRNMLKMVFDNIYIQHHIYVYQTSYRHEIDVYPCMLNMVRIYETSTPCRFDVDYGENQCRIDVNSTQTPHLYLDVNWMLLGCNFDVKDQFCVFQFWRLLMLESLGYLVSFLFFLFFNNSRYYASKDTEKRKFFRV